MPIDRNSAQYITGAIYKPTQTSAPGVWDLDDQANNIAKNLWPLPPNVVQRSLRFNRADSTVLTRTPTVAGNRRTWTWSGWFKTSALLNANYHLFDTQPSATYTGAYITSTGALEFRDWQSGSFVWVLTTSTLYRDPSAWYHVVFVHDTTQATASDRIKIYVNGTQVTQFSTATYPSLNYQSNYNNTVIQYLGGFDGTTNGGFTGFIAEVNSIDGQALTPASFAETDPQTGVWIPKRYTGTYGTNGFRLSFANNSSITALGYDSSGQGNNWTPNNFSITPGVGNDVFVDVPSLYGTDTGLGGEVLGNYATFNPLVTQRLSLSDGNLKTNWVTSWGIALGSIAVNSGMWYFESYPDAGQWHMAGVDQPKSIHTSHVGGNSTTKGIAIVYDPSNTRGDISYNGGNSVYTGGSTTFNSGDVIGVALDLDNNNVKFYKNNILQYNLSNLLETGAYYTFAVSMFNGGNIYGNFGQRPFKYTAPTGYKALCTTNLPAPAIGQTAANQADNHFDVLTYVGNGSARSITGLSFQPDLVWIKQRTGAATAHSIQDSVRGVDKHLTSNGTDIEVNSAAYGGGVTAFNANGFSIGTWGAVNENTQSYVAWCWNAGGVSVTNNAGTNGASVASTYRANRAAGFSIVTYTGTGVGGATIAHGLGVAPKLIITKARLATGLNWAVYHASLGATKNLWLSNVDPVNTQTVVWNDTAPSSAVFTVGSAGNANSTQGVVAYCWAEIPGFSAFGSYTGNASTDGSFVYTGFKPAFILIKDVNNANSWILMDNKRTGAYNPQDGWLVAQAPDTEYNVSTSDSRIDFLSNGFKLRNSNAGNNGSRTYIYAAFAETPARLSTAR